jgi:mono/diheme cytochrome c family protein
MQAVAQGDTQAQQEFLHHCVTCHDNLAFMLARRALLRLGGSLPADWEAVSQQLEQAGTTP